MNRAPASSHLPSSGPRRPPLWEERAANRLFLALSPRLPRLRRAYRYLDLRRHAPRLRVQAAAYVGGALDPGARPGETRELAHRAGAELLLVPEAGHLEAIKRAGDDVVGLALATFERAENLQGRPKAA